MKYLFSILTIIALSISGCALKEVIDLSTNSAQMKPPKWDMKFNVPLIEKSENLDNYFKIPNILNVAITLPPFNMIMHLPGNTSLGNLPVIPTLLPAQTISPTTVSQAISVDLDEDGTNDVTVTEIKSSTGFVEMTISMKKDGVDTPMEPGDIGITNIEIEAIKYIFNNPTKATSDGKLVFTTTNFLSDKNLPIQPDNTGDPNKIDVKISPDFIKFNTLNKNSALDDKDLSNPLDILSLVTEINDKKLLANYEFTFQVSFSFGTDYEIIGIVENETSLFEVKNQQIPLTESQNIIDQFTISLKTDNHLPIGIQIKNGSFSNSNFDIKIIEKLIDDTTTDIIDLPIGEKNTLLTTTDSIFNKGALGLNMELVVPAKSELHISHDMYLKFIMGLRGDGQIDLQYF